MPFHSNIPEHLHPLFPQQQNTTTKARRILLLTFLLLNLNNKTIFAIVTFCLSGTSLTRKWGLTVSQLRFSLYILYNRCTYKKQPYEAVMNATSTATYSLLIESLLLWLLTCIKRNDIFLAHPEISLILNLWICKTVIGYNNRCYAFSMNLRCILSILLLFL